MTRRARVLAPLIVTAAGLGCSPATTPRTDPAVGTPPTISSASPAISTPDASKAALAVADAVIDQELNEDPDHPALMRLPGARFDHLPDESLAGIKARDEREDKWAADLKAIDPAKLADPQALLAYQIATETLETRKAVRVCRSTLWNVSQTHEGWPVRIAILADAQPTGTPELRAQTLKRFAAVPQLVDDHIASVREGMKLGYTMPVTNVKEVLEQVDGMSSMPTKFSPFMAPARQDPDPDFAAALEKIVVEKILPKMKAYKEFVEKEYLPKARTTPAVASNPDGAACYRASVRKYTSLELTAEEIHQRGLKQLAAIEEEMKALSAKSFKNEPLPKLLTRFKNEPGYRYKDKAAITAQAEKAVGRAKAALPRVVTVLPRGDIGVQPIPPPQDRMAPAHYLQAALDGSHPAFYRIRLYKPEQQPVLQGEATTFHETIPGHHVQITVANESAALPRIARFHTVAGYGEGWALYAERFADELGLYSTDVDRMGMLSSAAFRAVRLVVDTGLHAMGWDRKKAIDTLLEHTAMSQDQATSEVERYVALPGQATSYMLGYMEIAALRKQAEAKLGSQFDVRVFHDKVLENGNVTLPMLRRHIEAWLAAPPANK